MFLFVHIFIRFGAWVTLIRYQRIQIDFSQYVRVKAGNSSVVESLPASRSACAELRHIPTNSEAL